MSVGMNDIQILFDSLPEDDQKTVVDFMKYLSKRSSNKSMEWKVFDQMPQDEEPLSEEEILQLNSNDGYVTGEEAKREFGIQANLP